MQTNPSPTQHTVSLAVWISPDILMARIDLGASGKIRFAVTSNCFEGAELQGWSSELIPHHQWRAQSAPGAEIQGSPQTIWVNGLSGEVISETRMVQLLLIAREDMSEADRKKYGRLSGLFSLVEAALHGYGAFGILDDLALRIPAAKRQFNTKIYLTENMQIVLESQSLDASIRLLMAPEEHGIEFELLDIGPDEAIRAKQGGFLPSESIHREGRDAGFHEALDRFITLAPVSI